jgi:hypothetical protein
VRRTVQTHRCDDRQQQGKKWMLRSHVTHESTRDQISFYRKSPSTTEGRESSSAR